MATLVEKVLDTIPHPEDIISLQLKDMKEFIIFKWHGYHFHVSNSLKVKDMENKSDAAAILFEHLLNLNHEPEKVRAVQPLKVRSGSELADVIMSEPQLPIYEKFWDYRELLQKVMRNKYGKQWVTRSLKYFADAIHKSKFDVTTQEFLSFNFSSMDSTNFKGGVTSLGFLIALQQKLLEKNNSNEVSIVSPR